MCRLGVWAGDAQKLRRLATSQRLDLCFGSIAQRERGYALDAFLPEEDAKALAAQLTQEGFRCTVSPAHAEEEPEISMTNRYVTEVPRGVGIKR